MNVAFAGGSVGKFKSPNVLSFSTHNTATFDKEKLVSGFILPTTSLYERSGHFRVLEGRLRKHVKVVSKPVNAVSVESILSALSHRYDENT